MADWKFQPSTTLSRKYNQGDPYAELFRGEARKLLYELKIHMGLRNLGQLKMTRIFTDGTRVIAWSFINLITNVSQDFVRIDTSRTTVGFAISDPRRCSITFMDLPDIVAPMRYPGEIHAGEVSGTDYLKIYYTIDVSECSACEEEAWNLCDINVPECDQFKFVLGGIPSVGENLNDHCIYSASTCHAQLIDHGIDGVGRYLIFKVFTEWGWVTPENLIYSRSGLGYMLLKGKIEDANGNVICEVQDTLMVDCCHKPESERQVILWDESLTFPFPREWINTGGNNYYKTPATLANANLLYWYGAFGSGAFWVLPESLGSCYPFTWELEGLGELKVSDDTASAVYVPPDNWVDLGMETPTPITIRVRDRCGSEDSVTTEIYDCCWQAQPLSIDYTSLQMECDGIQNFDAVGGCGPYSWSLSGGGSLSIIQGSATTYTAPSSNAGCSNNATITLTDKCGTSTSIQIAIDCYSNPYTVAYKTILCGAPPGVSTYVCNFGDIGCLYGSDKNLYNCHGDYLGWEICADCSGYERHAGLGETCSPFSDVFPGSLYDNGADPGCDTPISIPYECNQTWDVRTGAMVTDGCCPINPYTGLPF